MKYAQALIVLGLMATDQVCAESSQQKSARNLLDTSLVMLEAGVPAPPTASIPINQNTLIGTGSLNMADAEADRKKKSKKGTTTLTIVQDFPKKQVDHSQASTMNLVQGKEKNMNMNLESSERMHIVDKKRPQTLTIVQDFPKKKHSENAPNVEMVQGQNKDVNIIENAAPGGQAPITLRIVQDFPKKAGKGPAHDIEMVQSDDKDKKTIPFSADNVEPSVDPSADTAQATAGNQAATTKPAVELTIAQDFKKITADKTQVSERPSLVQRGLHKLALVQTKLGEAKTFIEDLFGVNN